LLVMSTTCSCGTVNEGAKFCGGCGTKVENTCSNCGAPVVGKWCGECGAAMQVSEPSQPAVESKPAPAPVKAEASRVIADTITGKAASDGFLSKPTVIVSSGSSTTELKLDSANPRWIDGSNYRLKLANESVYKHVLGLWDAGIRSSPLGIVVTGIYLVMADTALTEDFVAFSMQMGTETENAQGYWCANSEANLAEVLSVGFKSTTNLSFALDPLDAIRGNVTGPKKVVIAKLVLKNSRNVAGKVIIPVGRGACPTYIVNYTKK